MRFRPLMRRLALPLLASLLVPALLAATTTRQAPTARPMAATQPAKKAAKRPAKQPAKRATNAPTSKRPTSKPAAMSKVEVTWQIDAWEARFRAAWIYYVLVEWKKYTRDPKLSTKQAFAVVTRLRKEKPIFAVLKYARKHFSQAKHPILRRRVDMLWEQLREYHLSAKVNQLRGEIHSLTDKLNGIQASYRAMYDGKKRSNRDLSRVIRRSADRSKREAAWRAYASVGPHVLKGGFMTLVRKRNAYAKQLGFPSFFHYRYHKLKLDPRKMWKIYESLRVATRPAMQRTLAAYRALLKVKQVMPWDGRYARHIRAKQVVDLDKFFAAKRLLPILFKAYKEMGFDLKSMQIKMDLYPRPNKNQHAYCFDIDPPHDVRILANVGRPGQRPYETLFHEMGHAVHGKLVRQQISTFRALPDEGFLNEGSANFFGNIVDTKEFYHRYLQLPPKALAKVVAMKRRQLDQRRYLIRWTLLWMYFERDLYTTHAHSADPTAQFWKRHLQFMGPAPKGKPPYWGMLIHFVSHPIYYQNYLLADMLAAQLHAAVKRKTGRDHIFGNDKVAPFLSQHFFAKGRRVPWDTLLQQITGKPLDAKAYLASLHTSWESSQPGAFQGFSQQTLRSQVMWLR